MGKHGRYLGTNSNTMTAPDGSLWYLVMQWAEVDGRAECVGLTVQSHRPERDWTPQAGDELGNDLRPVLSEVIRSVTTREIEESRAEWIELLGALPDGADDLTAFTAGRVRKIASEDGTPLPPEEALAKVADVYRAAWQRGDNPTKAVAERFNITRSAASKRVRRARDHGLLPETTKGKPRAFDETKAAD